MMSEKKKSYDEIVNRFYPGRKVNMVMGQEKSSKLKIKIHSAGFLDLLRRWKPNARHVSSMVSFLHSWNKRVLSSSYASDSVFRLGSQQ